MSQTASKPSPIRTPGTNAFFDGAKRGQLMIQHCRSCERYNIYGHYYCPYCLSQSEWRPSVGVGKVSSFVIVRHCTHPGFKDELPYAVAEVQLEEGPSLSLRVVGKDAIDIRIDQMLKIDFLGAGNSEVTPVWATI
jgi:uncharacterized OB-fold protein